MKAKDLPVRSLVKAEDVPVHTWVASVTGPGEQPMPGLCRLGQVIDHQTSEWGTDAIILMESGRVEYAKRLHTADSKGRAWGIGWYVIPHHFIDQLAVPINVRVKMHQLIASFAKFPDVFSPSSATWSEVGYKFWALDISIFGSLNKMFWLTADYNEIAVVDEHGGIRNRWALDDPLFDKLPKASEVEDLEI